MPENSATVPSANLNCEIPGQAYYDKTRKQLRELLQKRRELEQALAAQEELIAKKEQEYLEETPSGNIIAGFDNYTKGGVVAGRRRGREEEERERRLRIFSRSSISWNPQVVSGPLPSGEQRAVGGGAVLTRAQGPGEADQSPASSAAAAGTPTSTTFQKTEGIAARKNKKAADDSDSEGRDAKRARVSFGVVRK